MKKKNQNSTCPDSLSNECVVWQGGDVLCLGICNGDKLSDAEKAIADKVCEIASDLDLSQVDISCVLDKCKTVSNDKSVSALIQILFDNQCCLKDLIDSINGGDSGNGIPNLNLRCLKKFDDFGNEIPQNDLQVLQTIINQVCQNVTDIAALRINVNDLQTQVDDLSNIATPKPEPSVSTCLTGGLRPVSQAVPLIADEVCTIKQNIGTAEQMASALSRQCENANEQYITKPGWEQTVSNISQTINNLWIILCDVKARVETIENNCCKITCKSIKLGFGVIPSPDAKAITLKFTEKAGTEIPNGFTDCGSVVTITDHLDNSVEYPITISQNAEEGEFFLDGLNLEKELLISISARLCSTELTCEKCVSKMYLYEDPSCPICRVDAVGKTGTVTILYEEPQ